MDYIIEPAWIRSLWWIIPLVVLGILGILERKWSK